MKQQTKNPRKRKKALAARLCDLCHALGQTTEEPLAACTPAIAEAPAASRRIV